MNRAVPVCACLLIFGCTFARVNVDIVSERTSLENQVLGTYNSLDKEMLLVASVRGVDPEGHARDVPRSSGEHKDAVSAMQVLDFHADDLAACKKLGWVGENTDGLVTAFEMDRTDIPADLQDFASRYTKNEFEYVVNAVNNARETVMKRVVETNENLTDADMPEIRRIFGKLNAESAQPGDRIQTPEGKWIVKK